MKKKIKSSVVMALIVLVIYIANLVIYPGSAICAVYTFFNPDTTNWFTWSIPDANQVAGTALDVSGLLDAPAGKHGYIRTNGENFEFFNGTVSKSVRFWGANISGSGLFMENAQADILANKMAMSGMNIARLISLDGDFAYPNIFGNDPNRTTVLNAASLNKFHYLWSKLKEKGIYLYVELLDYRKIKSGDGATYTYSKHGANVTNFFTGSMDLVNQYDPYLIDLQKQYAQQLLTSVNPYTGTTIANDPAVVMIAIDNEMSLSEYGTETFNADISFEYYRELLKDKFNAWLRAKYGNLKATLQAAWDQTGYVGVGANEGQNWDDAIMGLGMVEIPIDYLSAARNYSPKRKADTLEFLSTTEAIS